jgi:hypothetical protein
MVLAERVKRVTRRLGECIYCGEEKEFSPEHYLPECLGKFKRNETLDDRICRDCNNRIGRELEDQFCRAGEIGFLRYGLGIEGKKRKEEVNPFERGSSGSSPLKMKGKIPGSEEEIYMQLVKGSREGITVGVDYIPQVILTAESGTVHHVLLTNMTEPEQLKAKIEELNIVKLKQVNVVATESERELVEKLTSFLPEVQEAKWENLPMSGKTPTRTEYEVTDRYFRAIAKIGFHYALKHFPHFRGDEETFAGIRDFIMNGGSIPDYVTWSQKQVIEQIKAGYTPVTFGHVILARANEHLVWCRLQFFLGPDTVPLVYTVALARNRPAVIYDITSGHSFCYYAEGIKDGYAGEMDSLVWIHKAPVEARQSEGAA